MLEMVFLACAIAAVYCTVIYPVLLGLIALAAGTDPRSPDAGAPPTLAATDLPRVSLLIPAHDEEAVIGRKIENCLALRYPPDRIEILVLSDGSRDATVERARAAAASGKTQAGGRATVRVLDDPRRRGKTACINDAVPKAAGEILVHTDANAWLESDALLWIVAPFADPRVGCVVGELVYTNIDEPAVGGGEGLYWRYENFIKQSESRLGCTITANGGIYALRRDLFEPLPDHIAGDAADPLIIARRGYATLFETRARARERAASSLGEEFRRKTRIMTQGLAAGIWVRGLLVPPRPWLAFEYFSHKLLRWFLPVFLVGALVASALLIQHPGFAAILSAQLLFYIAAAIGIALASRRDGTRRRPASLPVRAALAAGYFCVVNAAAAVALWDFARGVRLPIWEKSASTRSG